MSCRARGVARRRQKLAAISRDQIHGVGYRKIDQLEWEEEDAIDGMGPHDHSVELHDFVILHGESVHVVVIGNHSGADLLVLRLGHLTNSGRAPVAYRA